MYPANATWSAVCRLSFLPASQVGIMGAVCTKRSTINMNMPGSTLCHTRTCVVLGRGRAVRLTAFVALTTGPARHEWYRKIHTSSRYFHLTVIPFSRTKLADVLPACCTGIAMASSGVAAVLAEESPRPAPLGGSAVPRVLSENVPIGL
jgi:hypothetical protein